MRSQLVRNLVPEPERDPSFGEYLGRVGETGLRTLAAMECGVAIVMYVGGFAGSRWIVTPVWVLIIGLLTLGVSFSTWRRSHMRLIGGISTGATCTTLALRSVPGAAVRGDDYTLAAVTLVILTAVATVPFRPMHILAIGLPAEIAHLLSWRLAPRSGSAMDAVYLGALTAFSMFLASRNYRSRREEFDTAQDAVRIAEALGGAQLRAQLAENAVSIGKMAAALTHEMNSPLGALRSSIATLITMMDRPENGERRQQMAELRAGLHRSINESIERIDDVMQRLRRFIGLEEAELKAANLNELLADVTLLHENELRAGSIRVDLDLDEHLPLLTCRPQLLSAVFSSLLSNAVRALEGRGHIVISTRRDGAEVEVTVRDDGRGMSPEEADGIFDPSLKVADNRVSSANWSLFNSRQIVYEHGGEIRIETAEGKGAAFHVRLPLA